MFLFFVDFAIIFSAKCDKKCEKLFWEIKQMKRHQFSRFLWLDWINFSIFIVRLFLVWTVAVRVTRVTCIFDSGYFLNFLNAVNYLYRMPGPFMYGVFEYVYSSHRIDVQHKVGGKLLLSLSLLGRFLIKFEWKDKLNSQSLSQFQRFETLIFGSP